MIKKILLSVILLIKMCTAYSVYYQGVKEQTKEDSLRKEITTQSGNDKTSTQLELAIEIINNNVNEALSITNSALSDALRNGNKNLLMRSYFTLGRIYDITNKEKLAEVYYDTALTYNTASDFNWYKGDILFRKGTFEHRRMNEIKALEYFNSSIQACRQADNFRIMASTYAVMGSIFRVDGLYDRAIEYTVNSKLQYEKAGFLEGNAWAAYLLGRIYSDLKLHQKALKYFQEALETYITIASKNGDPQGVALCYEQIGLTNLTLGNFKEAHSFIDSAVKIYTELNSIAGLSNSKKNLGMIEYSMGNYDLAEKYLNESLKVKNEIGDLLSIPTIHEYLGLCMIGRGQVKEGFKELHQGLDLSKSNNQKNIQLNIYSKLAEAYQNINDLENVISCQRRQIEIQNSILTGDADIKFEQLQTIYEIDKQNSQILDLEKQNKINSLIIGRNKTSQRIMIGGILIAILFSITIYLLYKKIDNKNRELIESNAAKDKFFAIISHDLRGPVGNLASYMEHLNENFDDHSPEEIKKILSSLYKSAENVSSLLENLLIWAQSQKNKVEYSPAELNLSEVFKTTIKGLKQTADSKNIAIGMEINDQLSAWADPNMVQTIFRNIISNAIKFTPRGGIVKIQSESIENNNVSICITDNGVGIEQSTLAKIYDISGNTHTKGTEGERSTGLGLIIVKDFIERNRGTISIKSQKDEGTTICITLPASDQGRSE